MEKLRINCFGDFKCDNVEHLRLSETMFNLIKSADINLLNFEAPIKDNHSFPIKKSGPNICQDPKAPEWLEKHGFNVFALANNHFYDYGVSSCRKTIEAFNDSSILVGAGNWDEAYKLKICQIADIKIGFLSATHCEFGTLTDPYDKSQIGSAWICHPQIVQAIIDAKKEVDKLIFIAHAGIEYLDYPLPEWREVYRSFVRLGCDAVVASHTHVPQGWEIYKGCPICYSLGNFCFDLRSKSNHDYWNDGLVATIDIDNRGKISLSVHALVYNKHTLSLNDDDEEMKIHLEEICRILNEDTNTYVKIINQTADDLWREYCNLFTRSGFIKNIFSVGFLKGIGDWIKMGDMFNKTHVLNNIQCESHRWMIQRALNKRII